MNYQQIVERIRRAAPTLLEPEILSLLNEGQDMFCEETGILEGEWTFQTNGDMFFPIDSRCATISQVDFAGQLMNEFGGDAGNVELQK